MTLLANSPRVATRLAFLVAGFSIACWAPMVPFAKERLNVDEAVLGILLLCLGLGSVVAMLAAGPITSRTGTKPIVVIGGLGVAVLLPVLAIANTPLTLGVALALFGGFLGILEVAMNIHAVEVEKLDSVPLMSGFHAHFSIGGFFGASVMTLAMTLGASLLASALIGTALMLVATVLAASRMLETRAQDDAPLFVTPHGFVVLLASLAVIMFLIEGAILDWGALLLTLEGRVPPEQGGLGYMMFAIAMTAGRLIGDSVTAKFGDFSVLFVGGLVAVAGIAVVLASPFYLGAMAGFVLIGLGSSNVAPVFFRLAGAQKAMPANLAITAVTSMGYAGILIGPAAVGFVANHIGLPNAFWFLAALLFVIPMLAKTVTARS
ncbi:MFS transporter [Rhizobium leguminosarum]|nr:MFS transporter [Rhizobium leguminosarum]